MFTFEAKDWVPQFILDDKNGYAIAKAIEAAMQYLNTTILQSVDQFTEVEDMPEWRLDELAWETNCLYDYNVDVETKRRWIINAIPYYRLYGTPKAIYNYIGSYFDSVEVEENWIYNGEPYHFRVIVDGEWNPANEAWARRAIDKAKNVRSVLDALAIGCRSYIGIMAEGEVAAKFTYPLTGPSNYAGRWPQENIVGVIDNSAKMGVDSRVEEHKFPYPMTGTRPEINTLGTISEGQVGAGAEAAGHKYDYPMTTEEMTAGTHPQEATLGVVDSAHAAASGDAAPYKIAYPITGTVPQENILGITSDNNIQSAQAEDTYMTIDYKLCGQDEF